MTKDGYRRAAALLGARLRGDEEGERILLEACDGECLDLIENLLLVASGALAIMAAHDGVSSVEAADGFAHHLRQLG